MLHWEKGYRLSTHGQVEWRKRKKLLPPDIANNYGDSGWWVSECFFKGAWIEKHTFGHIKSQLLMSIQGFRVQFSLIESTVSQENLSKFRNPPNVSLNKLRDLKLEVRASDFQISAHFSNVSIHRQPWPLTGRKRGKKKKGHAVRQRYNSIQKE